MSEMTMKKLLGRLIQEEDGHHPAVYALWVGTATAIVEPYAILAVVYRLADLFLLFANQVRALSW